MLMKNDSRAFSVCSKAGLVVTEKGGKHTKWKTILDAVDKNLSSLQNQAFL